MAIGSRWPRWIVIAAAFGLCLAPVALLRPPAALAGPPQPAATPQSAASPPSAPLAADPLWTHSSGLDANVSALALDPTDPRLAYAGGDGGVYRSSDSGAHWTALGPATAITCLALDPLAPLTLYAGAWEGVYKSTDGGRHWASAASGLPYGPAPRTFAVDPAAHNTVYAGCLYYGVYKSTDGGAGWFPANSGLPTACDVYALSLVANTPPTLYAATNRGLFKSTDGATTWQTLGGGLAPVTYRSVLVDPGDANTVYAAGTYNPYYAAVYRSLDGGGHWELANSGVVGAEARSLALASGVLYLTTDGGVFRSEDGGRRWRGLYPGRPAGLSPGPLAVLRKSPPEEIYLGAAGGQDRRGVWRCSLSAPPPLYLPPAYPPKAVLIVGPIDAPTNHSTQVAIDGMEARAVWLESRGLQVLRLYHPQATWQNVRAVLSGASLVLYEGHGFGYNPGDGNYLGSGGGNNGFCLSDPGNPGGATLATQDMLIAYTQLAENAVVMSFACYSAGSSASDTVVASEEVARRRVNDYAYTFLASGAGAYYAGGDWGHYLDYMLASPERTMGAAFQTAPGRNPTALRAFTHGQFPAGVVWLDPALSEGGEVVGWWTAFAGSPALTSHQVFDQPAPRLGVSPLSLSFLLAPGDADLASGRFQIANLGSGTLRWQARPEPPWLACSPPAGTAPANLTVTVNKAGLAEGRHTGILTISCEGAVADSPQAVRVVVYVGRVWRTHLPGIGR